MANPETVIFSWPRLNRPDDVVVWAARLIDRIATSGLGAGAGPQGPPGPAGQPGVGVPPGGLIGQILTKAAAMDYATAWQDPTGGGGGDGSTIITDVGPPGPADGAIGDYYIDTAADIMYGPKADVSGIVDDSAWPTLTPPTTGVGNYEVGTRFTLTVARNIIALCFYRIASATETSRKISMWDTSGTLLAQAITSPSDETGYGWKTIPLAAPVYIPANHDVIVSYSAQGPFGYATGVSSTNPHITYVEGRYIGSAAGGDYPATAAGGITYMTDLVARNPSSPVEWPVALEGGGAGAPQSFHFIQPTAASTWTITHNLSFRPSVNVVDSTGREVVPGAVVYTSDSVVTLTFSAAFGGEAYLS